MGIYLGDITLFVKYMVEEIYIFVRGFFERWKHKSYTSSMGITTFLMLVLERQHFVPVGMLEKPA